MIYGSSRGRAGGIPYAWLGRVEQSMNKSGGGESQLRGMREEIYVFWHFLPLQDLSEHKVTRQCGDMKAIHDWIMRMKFKSRARKVYRSAYRL